MILFKTLLLNGNRLSNEHSLEGLKNLQSLETLSLADSQLETLPESFKELQSLKKLSLEDNSRFDLTMQVKLVSISSLVHAEIRELEDIDVLKELLQLRELNLRGNPVCQLNDCHKFIKTNLPKVDLLY